jgi:hypothetical protein
MLSHLFLMIPISLSVDKKNEKLPLAAREAA